MKKISILGIALFAALFCGCSDEVEEIGNVPVGQNTLIANIDGIQSRTSVDADGAGVLWSKGDAIGVYTSEGNFVKYDLVSGVGEKTAVFSLNDAGKNLESGETPLFAVYPYQYAGCEVVKIDKEETQYNRFKMSLPQTIDYTTCSNGPMFAVVKDNQLSFDHMTGLLKLSMKAIPENAAKIKLQAPVLWGSFNGYYKNQDGTYKIPVLESVSDKVDNSELIINLPTGTDNKITTGNLYIPMAAFRYSYLDVFFYDTEDNLLDFRRKTKEFTVERGAIYSMAEIEVTKALEVDTKDNFYKAVEEGKVNITVTSKIELDKDIALVSTSKISFKVAPAIAENVKFTKGDNCTITTFTIGYPYAVAEESAALTNLDLNLPECKVVLQSTDESQSTYSAMDEKSMGVLNGQVNAGELAISKVQASITAKSIYLADYVCLDKMTITGNVTLESLITSSKSFLLRVLVTSGSSVNETTISGIEGESCGLEDYWIDENASPRMARSLNLISAVNASAWDGISKKEPAKTTNGEYVIRLAEELAWFMSVDPPTAAKAGDLKKTIVSNVKLMRNIDLQGYPWVGAVIKEATFDGNNKTIYNLNIEQFIMNQQGTVYTPEACVGLFAAAYKDAIIKNLTLDGVTITCSTGSPKWVGSLVGYSYGATAYTNCVAKNVNINMTGGTSYRVGGLIGYIEGFNKLNEPKSVVLTNCEVNTATIAATFSYGGLVGSMYDSATFDNCMTSGITLNLNDSPWNYGYVSKFIGDIANSVTSYNRTILIKDCTAEDLTDTEKANLRFDRVVAEQNSSYLSGTYVGGCKWCGLVEPVAGVLENNKFTIEVTENGTIKTLVNGIDFNVCQ